jgi:hypothetical protein
MKSALCLSQILFKHEDSIYIFQISQIIKIHDNSSMLQPICSNRTDGRTSDGQISRSQYSLFEILPTGLKIAK